MTSAFSHRIHAEEGLACSDCHAGVEDSDDPGMPRLPACMLCHADLDEEKPVERQVKTLYAGEDPAGPRISEVGDEVGVDGHLLRVDEIDGPRVAKVVVTAKDDTDTG